MSFIQVLSATLVSLIIILISYNHIGFKKILDCYSMWQESNYWTSYNKVEFLSWVTKAIIIVPGLIFGVHIWWLYFFTLITSILLIWASNKKLLPTLVAFNTLWVWISCMVISQHIF
jgi:hypothetical protein